MRSALPDFIAAPALAPCTSGATPVWYAMLTPAQPGENNPGDSIPRDDVSQTKGPVASYGLRREEDFSLETLAQSVSTMARAPRPRAPRPLWFARSRARHVAGLCVATAAVLLVAMCVASFARYSSLARLALYLCFVDDSAEVDGAPSLCGALLPAYVATGSERHRRLLSVRTCSRG